MSKVSSSSGSRRRARGRSKSPLYSSDSEDERRRRRKGRHRSPSSDSESDYDSRHSASRRRRAGRRDEEEYSRKTAIDREKRRKEKEVAKAMETPEEKRARRLAKKEAKRKKELEKFGWDSNDLGYTNVDNPFGDKGLLDKFVWHKKRDKEGQELKMDEDDLDRLEQKRRGELKLELEKVKKRRQEREREREAAQEEMEMMQRMKEAEMFSKWSKEEDEFHLNQARIRSQIRIESGRAKPIDLLAKYSATMDKLERTREGEEEEEEEEELDIEMQEPYHLLKGLNRLDLEDLLVDIGDYIEADLGQNKEYWKDMQIICEDELHKLKQLDPDDPEYRTGDRRGGINTAVTGDVATIFKGKTHGQLLAIQAQIQSKLEGGVAVDVGYWESLLHQLKAYMARARLHDRHQTMLQKQLFKLKQEQLKMMGSDEGNPLFPAAEVKTEPVEEGEEPGPSGAGQEEEEEEEEEKPGPAPSYPQAEPESVLDEEDILQQAFDAYEKGGYSPRLARMVDAEEELIVDPEEDSTQLSLARMRVRAGEPANLSSTGEDAGRELVQQRGEDGTMEDEYNFNSEVALDTTSYVWQDKYKPRKPRFFNRVHTGYEWNKYNQTHYDHDNPPPKIVQGYKFNIFYPDLIDKRKTPEFFLEPCKDSQDFAILRFHAGPPYEDIAFKIVNREWECSWKRGFRSQFNNNIFQLWFRFKRNRYRR